ncbi:hypothetical protein [Kitasatospora sp. NPDC092286]|uniref:hypothetical protein n=1 Tax=Kitasatospora sp. NPDC092286 TaxID=3364087 RepID=UPI003822BD65
MSEVLSYKEMRPLLRANGRRAVGNPLLDYDPGWFNRVVAKRPVGWPPCTCNSSNCPGRVPPSV